MVPSSGIRGGGPYLGSGGDLGIRGATETDLEEILEIYNDAVVNTTATFDLTPRTIERQVAWLAERVGLLEEVGLKSDRRLNVAVCQQRCGS